MSKRHPISRPYPRLSENEEETNGKETNNVVDLITLPGGKGPTDTHPNDWLSPLKDGTIFLFYNKKNPHDPNLGQGKILHRTEKAIYLGFVVNGQPMQGPVDPVRFSNTYGMFESLGVLLELEEEIADEQSSGDDQHERDRLQGNSTGSDGDLAGDETLQGVPEGPRET